jgi:hypothetical protein
MTATHRGVNLDSIDMWTGPYQSQQGDNLVKLHSLIFQNTELNNYENVTSFMSKEHSAIRS